MDYFARLACRVEQLALRILRHLIYIFKNTELNGKNASVCIDGAVNITGRRQDVVEKVKKFSHPDILSTHCIAYHEQLVAKKCPQNYTKYYLMLLKS